jgi:ketosteroid isomerase-like protein
LMALYERDAILIPQPGAEPVKGTHAIRSALEGFLALKGKIELRRSMLFNTATSRCCARHGGSKAPGLTASRWRCLMAAPKWVRRQADGSWRYIIDHPFGSD